MHFRAYDVKYLPPEDFDLGEKMILMIFLSMRNLDEIFISHKNLSRQSSMSVPTVKRKLSLLKKKGVLASKTRGAGRTLNYEINDFVLVHSIAVKEPELFQRLERHFDITLSEVIATKVHL